MNEINVNEVELNGVKYIRKDSIQENVAAKSLEGLPYVLIRTYSAGVHIGYLKKRESTLAGIEVYLVKSRRIWYWDGAASISQIALDGVSAPKNCKFTVEVESVELLAIEILTVTEKARLNIEEVPVWKK